MELTDGLEAGHREAGGQPVGPRVHSRYRRVRLSFGGHRWLYLEATVVPSRLLPTVLVRKSGTRRIAAIRSEI